MLRKLMLAAVSASLILGVLAIPATAVDSTASALGINAIPGTKIDVCANGKVVVSGLRYSRAHRRKMIEPISQTWKIRKAAAVRCTGKRLAKFTYTFKADTKYTIVYWRPRSEVRVRVYVNAPNTLGPDEASMTFRHMARAGAIDVLAWQLVPAPTANKTGPTVAGLRRGHFSPPIVVLERYTFASAFPVKPTRRWSAEQAARNLDGGRAYQVVFMGTARKNMKLKFYAWPNV